MVDFRTSGWRGSGGGGPSLGTGNRSRKKKKTYSTPKYEGGAFGKGGTGGLVTGAQPKQASPNPAEQLAFQVLYGSPSKNPFTPSNPQTTIQQFQKMYGEGQPNPFQPNFEPAQVPPPTSDKSVISGQAPPTNDNFFTKMVERAAGPGGGYVRDELGNIVPEENIGIIELLGIGSMASGAMGIAKSAASKLLQVGKPFINNVGNIAGTYAVNAATIDKSTRLVAGTAQQVAAQSPKFNKLLTAVQATAFGTWFVQELGATYPFANFQKSEGLQALDFAYKDAAKVNDTQKMQEIIDLHNEITIPTANKLTDKIPFLNTQKAAKQTIEAYKLKMGVNQLAVNNLNEGKDWTAMALEYNETKLAEQKKFTDYINEQKLLTEEKLSMARQQQNEAFNTARIETEKTILSMREADAAKQRRLDLRAAKEQALFWLEYKQKLLEMEEEYMKKQGEFWLMYKQLVLDMQGTQTHDSGYSSLGFGLL